MHRSPVNSLYKGQWRGALMFSLICVWINGWVNNRQAGDLRWYCAHYDVTVMNYQFLQGYFTGTNKSKCLPQCQWRSIAKMGFKGCWFDISLYHRDFKWFKCMFNHLCQHYNRKCQHYVYVKWSNQSTMYNDVIMSTMVFQIISVSVICSTVCLGADQRKHQSSPSLVFVRGIHRWIPLTKGQ